MADATEAATPVAADAVEIRGITGSGTWTVKDGIIIQEDPAGKDFFAGTGVAAEQFSINVIVTLPTAKDLADSGGGIIFDMRGRDDPAQGTMIRFGTGGKEIFWGSYDADRKFAGQGGAPIDIVAGKPLALQLTVRPTSFDITVNNKALVKDVPRQPRSDGRWIGLVSFRGPVQFSAFTLSIGK
jgi:hypothetical protein